MIYGLFTLFVALVISAVAAYYSIVGLTAIFSAAVIPIIIMGVALEVGKVTAAVWLKLNWHRATMAYKIYLVPAVAMLMLLTSMGIFGFLSKAHSDQSLVSGDVGAKLVLIDEKIKIERETIENARAVIKQLDDAVNGINAKGSDREIKLRDGSSYTRSAAELALQVRRSQAKDRDRLTKEIEVAQTKIVKLQEESAPIRAENRKVEAEVGPIKYIAALIYGDNPDQNILEKSVRWVIIIIVSVFDPLALVLILSAQQSIRWATDEKKQIAKETLQMPEHHEPAIEEDAEEIEDSTPPGWMFTNEKIESVEKHEHHHPDTHPYLNQGFKGFNNNLKPIVAKSESVAEPEVVAEPEPEKTEVVESAEDQITHIEKPIEHPQIYKRIAGTDYIEMDGKKMHKEVFAFYYPDLAAKLNLEGSLLSNRLTNSTFGSAFPSGAEKGDLFLRVDYVPNRLFKFNGNKWIEVDKNLTDSYTYNQQYINHLIDKLTDGELELDQLSATEQELVAEELDKRNSNEQP